MTVLTIYSKRDLWKVRDRNIAEIFVPSRQNIRIQCVAKMCLCESKGAFYVLSEESLPRGQIYQDAVLHCENRVGNLTGRTGYEITGELSPGKRFIPGQLMPGRTYTGDGSGAELSERQR